MQSIPGRVQKFLLRRLKKRRGCFFALQDTRQQSKVKHRLSAVVSALLLGLLSNRRTLRDVETLTEQLQGPWRSLVPRAISDTTLDSVLRQLAPEELQDAHVALNRELKRSKLFKQVPRLGVSLVVVDGKNLATLDHDAEKTAQPRNNKNEKWHRKSSSEKADYWLTPALRAALASTEAMPCLLQMPLASDGNETGTFVDFLEKLQASYGRSDILEVLSMDAGMTSLKNANTICDNNLWYIFGLKDNQPELFKEAQLLFEPLAKAQEPEAETTWENREGKEIRRRVWRSADFKNFENSVGVWKHLEQVWLVRQETRDAQNNITVEDRYFLSSIPWGKLSGMEIIRSVRLHWVIENNVFNSLDLQWREDSGTWCTQGKAVWNLGVLRMMAYTLVQCLRRRTCRKKRGRHTWLQPLPWRDLFEHIYDALRGVTVATVSC